MQELLTTYAMTAGEVAPSFYGRADLAKYDIGMALLRNFIVDYKGGLINRPGLEHILQLPYSLLNKVTFAVFKTLEEDFLLMFLDDQMIVLQNGAVVTKNSYVTSGALPAEVLAERFVWVEAGRWAGFHEVSGGSLRDRLGAPITLTESTTIHTLDSITTPFAAHLGKLAFEQNIDQVVATANGLQPHVIRVSELGVWSITPIATTFDPAGIVGQPTSTQSSNTSTVSAGFRVAAVIDGVEQLPSPIKEVHNMVDYSTQKGWVRIAWTAVPGATAYRVYRTVLNLNNETLEGAQYGYIGQTAGTAFIDNNIVPDFTKGPVSDGSPFVAQNTDPAIYLRFQQRGVYAATTEAPSTIWGSTVNTDNIFSVGSPLSAADSYSHTLDSNSPQPIYFVLPLRNGLLIFNRDGVTLLRGGENQAITPLHALAEPQGYYAPARVKPLIVGLDVLFLTESFSALYAMLYTEYTNSFQTQDVAVISNHLLSANLPIRKMVWVPEPHKVAYLLRADGKVLALTYDREQEVFAWSVLETQGRYLDVITVREGDRRVPYFLIERGRGSDRYLTLEREQPREASRIEDAFFVDNGLKRQVNTYGPALTLEAVDADNVVSVFGSLPGTDGDFIYAGEWRFERIGAATLRWLSGPRLTMGQRLFFPEGTVDYITPTSTVGNLWSLEGEHVSVLADGDAFLEVPVVGGELALQSPAGKVIVGLPFVARAKTLPLTSSQTNIDGMGRRIIDLSVRVDKTRGLAVGADFDKLYELRERGEAYWGDTPVSHSRIVKRFLGTGFSLDQTLAFEQRYPLPANLLTFSILMEVANK